MLATSVVPLCLCFVSFSRHVRTNRCYNIGKITRYTICDDEEKEKDEEKERDEETTTMMALQYNSYYREYLCKYKQWKMPRPRSSGKLTDNIADAKATREELEEIIVSLHNDQDV